MARITRIDPGPIATLDEPVPTDRRIKGAPMRGTRPAYEHEGYGFYTGTWESEPGAWRMVCPEAELCTLLTGRIRLTAADGTAEEFGPGDSFVIPAGFEGTWETLEHCRKIYAICLPPGV
jgi:hypothetical protein